MDSDSVRTRRASTCLVLLGKGFDSAPLWLERVSRPWLFTAIMADTKQRLVYSIIEFLNDSIEDGTVKADDKESLEVASASLLRSLSASPNLFT